MRSKYFLSAIAILFVLAAVANFFVPFRFFPFVSFATKNAPFFDHANDVNATLSLLTEPDEGMTSVLSMIRGASTSVDLVMYELQDNQIEAALAADEARGVAVRLLLSAGYKGGTSTVNQGAYNFFIAHGVPVRWSPNYFALTHQKSLVVDSARALIMTFNLTPQYYSTSRDFGVVDNDTADVGAMEAVFNADWEGSGNIVEPGNNLVWSPGSASAILSIINGAHRWLYIYNEEMADPEVTAALIDAALRGIAVNIVMTYSPEWDSAFQELTTAGADVRTYPANAPLYIHAKMIVADGARAFVGSENFSAGSLDQNRELGILITDPAMITSLMKTFSMDQAGAVRFVN